MMSKQTVCLPQLAGSRAREAEFGRWRANDKVTPEPLIVSACARTGAMAAGRRHVRAIQDTTELNHPAHAGRVAWDRSAMKAMSACFSTPYGWLMPVMEPVLAHIHPKACTQLF
jgi:hypothetical protein